MFMRWKTAILGAVLSVHAWADAAPGDPGAGRWSEEKTKAWVAGYPWPVGCNYLPATAVNQLEMWQADTFDPGQIDRELAWAREIGFNTLRVFLHDLAWSADPEGFLGRMERFLAIAGHHRMTVLFVFFDGVWDPEPRAGVQPAPRPGVHNSRWVQSPGKVMLADASTHPELEKYVKTVIERFRADRRIIGWDLFNEPDHDNRNSYAATEVRDKAGLSLALLRKAFQWAREVNPRQPLTAGVWQGTWHPQRGGSPVAQFSLANSDVISFHWYGSPAATQAAAEALLKSNRPVWCTEYLARPFGSKFETILPAFKEAKVGAFHWGFVSGRTQTIFPWDSWQKPYAAEPPEWLHDVLRADGSPYRATEVGFLKGILLRDAQP
jgi:hypothetical protein